MQVSQKQIADALNLSVITVSRALRDHPDLAMDTKARILQKAREMGYTKALPKVSSAATLSNSANGASVPQRVGILLYESDETQQADLLKSDVRRRIFLALQKECQRHEIETLIEMPSLDTPPLLVKNRTVGGVFIFGRYTPDAIRHLGDTPALAVSSFIECEGLPRIIADNARGMSEATEHLIKLGHKKILFVSNAEERTRIFHDRADGYVAAMHRHGLKPEVQFIADVGALSLDQLRNFTALACASDGLAYMIQDRLLAQGWKLPERCSMVAFDNLAASDHSLKITSYAPDWDLMGRLAAGLLLSRPLDFQGQSVVITVPGHLIVRGSTVPA